jgi:purine-binding chemotaxis protein CheW
MLIFELGDDRYSVELARVTNVIEGGALETGVAGPEFLAGRMNVSGESLRVLDLKQLFGVTASVRHDGAIDESEHVVVFDSRTDDDVDAWLVDEVRNTVSVDVSTVTSPSGPATHVEGTVRTDEGETVWVDAEAINRI